MTPANHYQLAAFFTLGLNAFLVWIVFLRARHQLLSRYFIAYGGAIIFWSGFVFLATTAKDMRAALFFSQLCHVGAALIPLFFLHFIYAYLGLSTSSLIIRCINFLTGIFVIIILFFPSLFFSGVSPKFGFLHFPDAGLLYTPWFFLFAVTVIYAHGCLFVGALRFTGVKKKQAFFFLLANLAGYLGGIGCFLPVYSIDFFPFPFGPYGVALFSLVTTYTIFRHKFLDIEKLLRNTVVFTGLLGFVISCVIVSAFIIQNIANRYFDLKAFWVQVTGIILIVIGFEPIRRFLVNLTDRYLFQKKFNLTTIVAQAGEAISLVQSLRWLSRRIVAFLITKCRIQRAVIYTRSQDNENFERAALRGGGKEKLPRSLPTDHFLIQHLVEERRILERQRLEDQLQRKGKGSDAGQDRLTEILEFLKNMDAEVIIPSFLRNRIDTTGLGIEKKSADMELRNILILGGKKSDEPYSDEELAVFYGLAQESAIAIENARLYDEAVQRTKLLVEMNHELEETNQRLQVTQASLIVAEKNATMVGMAKAIGHEVNNPLSTVGGRSIWIYRDDLKKCRNLVSRYDTSLPEDFKKDLNAQFSRIEDNAKRIEKSAKRIEVVVKTLTDILKNTRGEKGPLSLLVLCREAREATRFLTYEENLSGCEITESIGANIIILGNLEQLLQVFINMIKNAYEAMIGRPERKILIRGLIDPREPGMARIEFIDSGPGIPENILPKIWEQGFSTKEKKENNIGAAGQGQGLFICKHVIESIHNGKIYAESKPGEGTTFVIKLPLVDLEG
ncbi:MAG: ATP-binding protein [Candidatus Omnitrophota bacterium]|jgi:signal transduction histidine kinase